MTKNKQITLKSIRFQKYDRYGNPIFIANQKDEPKLFNKLNKYYLRLSEIYPESFSPIYTSEEHNFSSIRFKRNYKHPNNLEPNDKFDIKFQVKKKVVEGAKIIINCNTSSIKLISKAIPIDQGEALNFTDSDTETDTE